MHERSSYALRIFCVIRVVTNVQIIVLHPLVLVRMGYRRISIIDILHYEDAMLEDCSAEVKSDHHLVSKWAKLSVRSLIARFVSRTGISPVYARI